MKSSKTIKSLFLGALVLSTIPAHGMQNNQGRMARLTASAVVSTMVHITIVSTAAGAAVGYIYNKYQAKQNILHDQFTTACLTKNYPKIERLVQENGTSIVHITNNDGETPLHHIAKETNNAIIANLLIDLGADVNVKDNDGKTPLHYACLYENDENYETTKLLIDHGANVNVKDNDGTTPLHCACHYSCHYENDEITKLLIDHGADVNVKDNDGETPLTTCLEIKQWKLINVLLTHIHHKECAEKFTTMEMINNRAIKKDETNPHNDDIGDWQLHTLPPELQSRIACIATDHANKSGSIDLPGQPAYQWLQEQLGKYYPEYREYKRQTDPTFDNNYKKSEQVRKEWRKKCVDLGLIEAGPSNG